MRLQGRAAIVTGGSRGIGRALAIGFAREGADVAINYRREKEAADETVAEIKRLGRKGFAYQCDVTDWEASRAMVESAAKDLGKIDLLVNNAGIASRGAYIVDTEIGEMRRIFDTHVFGAFHFCKAALPHMRKNPRSDVHFICSASPHLAPKGHGPYASAKIAVETFATILAKEENAHNVRVNSIACGVVETDMGKRLVKYTLGDDTSKLANRFPFGRVCQPEDVANLSIFLASDEGSYVSGHTIFLDGSDPTGVAKE